MIPKECKRLAEVDFPIAAVSKHSAREKSIRHGHPSTLQLWWARRPLAACRAMLMALLLPDPCDPNCPEEFKKRARNILPRVQGNVGQRDIHLRNELLRFISDFANWDNSTSAVFLEAAKGLIRAAHGEEPPLVVDPFAGGGSIPLEALRVGCDAFASDLNPVAYILLTVLLEHIPRCGAELESDFRRAAAGIRNSVESEVGRFYPSDRDGSRPIAYLWTRTVICDNCGSVVPLVRSFWLSTVPGRKRAVRYIVRRHGKEHSGDIDFEVFEPKNDSEVPHGTVRRAKAACVVCNLAMPPERLRSQLSGQCGGADPKFDERGRWSGGARLLGVAIQQANGGRTYRSPNDADYASIRVAQEFLNEAEKSVTFRQLIPSEPVGRVPVSFGVINVWVYGMLNWSNLFSVRQKLFLATLAKHIAAMQDVSLQLLLSSILSRCADYNSSLTRWVSRGEFIGSTFGRQALPMVWDFSEAVPWTDSSGNFDGAVDWVARVIAAFPTTGGRATAAVANAKEPPLPDGSASIWFTDPPYYDNVPYSYLSDYFYVWLRRALGSRLPKLFAPALTPKEEEIVAYVHPGDTAEQTKDRFELAMKEAFSRGRRVLAEDGIACVVFAHRTTEGWEAFLDGIITGGWTISGSWPITTEMAGRLRARDSAALAGSVHLVCRPRSSTAVIGEWAEVLRELPNRVGDWIERLQDEGLRGADLVFACIGPAMEVYSRYRRVEDAEGREIPLGGDPTAAEPYKRGFLAYVWETVGRMALEQVLGTAEAKARNGAAGALEEDSRLTALFLWTLQSTEVKSGDAANENGEDEPDVEEDDEESPKKKKAGYTLIYDVARRFAQPLGIHLDKWEGRIIETDKGIVRLLPVAERATQLFGNADAAAMARRIEQDVKAQRNYTFAFMQDAGAAPQLKTGKGRKSKKDSTEKAEPPAPQQVTTLDRVHAAMLLQSSGQTNGLRALLREEQQRGPDFIRLANALSALYPKDSEEKRLLDAMLLAVPRN